MQQRRLTIYGAIRRAFGNRLETSIRPGIAMANPLLVLANALAQPIVPCPPPFCYLYRATPYSSPISWLSR
jgi:hypothetical protein